MRKVVVFPAPFGPRNPNSSPLGTLEVDPVHRGELAVPLHQVRQSNHSNPPYDGFDRSRDRRPARPRSAARWGNPPRPGGERSRPEGSPPPRPSAARIRRRPAGWPRCPAPSRSPAARRTPGPAARRPVPPGNVRPGARRGARMGPPDRRCRSQRPPPPQVESWPAAARQTRAGQLIEAGHGRRERGQATVGRPQDGIRLDKGEIVDDHLNHRPPSSRPRRYISRASSGRFSRSSTRPMRWKALVSPGLRESACSSARRAPGRSPAWLRASAR